MSPLPPIQVRVVRPFQASPERVFDAWLDPQWIRRWMFGSAVRDEEVLRIANDARVGGTFSFLVRRNAQEIDHVGTYLVLDRPHRLVFTWAIGEETEELSRVSIDIAPKGAGCELTLVHEMDPKWTEYAGRTEAGWSTMLGALERALGTA
ncbi:Uncharacterized conserved protein YndB, AHSA1/START domain [Stigmatella aurantiaca]|uniref:Uncharacterized conserved protein YndB, AHSA1/START domain n=1 Tax=Stigmatella aurantiaca TaxID=41 RepID=A0A1H7UWG7_STIAU|nr:SRPBCC family protein [Stigmatella aurantiaca]SEM01313.1 Uncharacterized conserved protein YndB, AHSA1/START domain [Stigmatella aurantiaca]